MPELPEIVNLAAQVNTHLRGKTIQGFEILQPKCLNLPVEDFEKALTGATLESAAARGKWIVCHSTQGWLLINLGMGGELLLVTRASLPQKHRLIVDFTDQTCLAVNFWWFGYFHYAPEAELENHGLLRRIGPNALDLSEAEFIALARQQKGRLKAFLHDQSRVAGIGNAYIHDILYFARLHPLRAMSSLSEAELHNLYQGIHQGLEPAVQKGGSFYEQDLFGKTGNFLREDIQIGYREGEPCPTCQTPIVKIKTGGTSSFICPTCQPDPAAA